jgi:hypothetical protein
MPSGGRRSASGNCVGADDICDGLPVSTPLQAFLDLASIGVNLVDLVIAGDSLVKANNLDPQQFWRPPPSIRGATPGVLVEPLRWYVLRWTPQWRRGSDFSSCSPGYQSRKST